jgi:NTE family protein
MSGEKMRKTLHEIFNDIHIEDLWIPSFAVSTNFSTASLAVHESGLARKGIEASIAIPGVFPPVIIDKHLHIDGGVMDNLPVETMYQKPIKHIIAISLNLQANRLVEIEQVPSAWAIFINKITKKQRFKLPAMSSILINSLTLNSIQKQARTKSLVSLYVEMDLRKFSFLDWSKWEALIENGYQQTKAILNEMPKKGQFWK